MPSPEERRLIRLTLLTLMSFFLIIVIFDYYYGTGIQILPACLSTAFAGYIFWAVSDRALKFFTWIYLFVLIIFFSFLCYIFYFDPVYVFAFSLLCLYTNVLYTGWRAWSLNVFTAICLLILLVLYRERVVAFRVDERDISFTKPMRIFEAGAILVICYLYWSYDRDRKASLAAQDITSKENLSEGAGVSRGAEMNAVFESIARRDGSFMHIFINQFPEFVNSLTSLNPSITSSELEICAMLGLSLTTKQIAIATNSTYKSVEAKKYRIRKKLSLSSTENLVLFFNSLM